MKKQTITTSPAVPRVHADPEPARGAVAGLPSAPRRDIAADGDAKAREEAFHGAYFWQTAEGVSYELRPFGSGRESLWLQLRTASGAPGLEHVYSDVDTFFADACRILFLCSHEPEEYRSYRGDPGRFMEAIETWTDTNIPRDAKLDATLLAMRIVNQSGTNQHEPAPVETQGSADDSGN